MHRSLTIWESQSMAATATVDMARLRLTSKIKPLPLTLASRCSKMVTSLQHLYSDQELLHWIIPSSLNFPPSDSTVTMHLQLYGADISEFSSLYSPLRCFQGLGKKDIIAFGSLNPPVEKKYKAKSFPLGRPSRNKSISRLTQMKLPNPKGCEHLFRKFKFFSSLHIFLKTHRNTYNAD